MVCHQKKEGIIRDDIFFENLKKPGQKKRAELDIA